MGDNSLAAVSDSGEIQSDSLWRSLAYFNFYRLFLASLFLVAPIVFSPTENLASQDRGLFIAVDAAYWIVALSFVLTHRQLPLSFGKLLTLQVMVDVSALTLLLFASGGQKSGLAVMLIVVLAGASLVGQGRMSLFYAALATLALLLEQLYRNLMLGHALEADLFRVGIISLAFFATAIAVRFLAQRVISNEELARQRGAALADELRVNELIIRDMHDGVLVVDPMGAVRHCNPCAQALLESGELVGRRVAEFFPDLDQALGLFRPHTEVREMPVPFAPGGKSLQVRLVSAGADTVVFMEDTSRLQAQAQQMKLAALGRLTGGIAHEIRNRLSAMSHAADLLCEEHRADVQVRLTRIIHDNTRRLERIVHDVMELGRRDRAEPEQIDLDAFLSAFLDELCMHQQVARDRFACGLDSDGGRVTLTFDRAHLNQVLWNLLGNALRYASGAPGAIQLTASVNRAANRCSLHIRDDGPGIDAKFVGQVFEPFFTTHSKGTGLGLYIARELCDANGAALSLHESPSGAHFCITGKYRKSQ
jgi:two-component system sensor histidine kinase PilS (NtrC family)